MKKELERAAGGGRHLLPETMRYLGGLLSDYNTAMENATRLAIYETARSTGISAARAASLAKNSTVNFNRKGASVTNVGAMYAFFNASMQGSARLVETMTGPKGAAIAAGGILFGVLQAMAIAAGGFGDDEPPEFVRERNIIIPIGGKKYVTIPMPLGFHIIPNMGRIPAEYVLSGFRKPGSRVRDLLMLAMDAFNPVGGGASFAQTLTPTVLDPVMALSENKDWTGKEIAREDMNPLAPTPGHTRAKDVASEAGKVVSKAVNKATGGTEFQPGGLSPTPDQIDYIIGQVTGGVGRELPFPQSIRDHDDGMLARRDVIGGPERAAQAGADTEDREVVARDHLAEHAHPAAAARGARHLGPDRVREALRIRHPVAHDPREGRLGVEGDVGVRGPRRVQVDAFRAQAPLELFPVFAGGDDDPGLPGPEAVADEPREGVGERRIRLVELHDVLERVDLRHGAE